MLKPCLIIVQVGDPSEIICNFLAKEWAYGLNIIADKYKLYELKYVGWPNLAPQFVLFCYGKRIFNYFKLPTNHRNL